MFSYFVMLFVKPFEIGDFITLGGKVGDLEYIGIKTTRIRALSGEILAFSNSALTSTPLHNFKKMERRRVVFKPGMVYQTSSEKLEAIPGLAREIIEKQQGINLENFACFEKAEIEFAYPTKKLFINIYF